jgi:hypothetical protein
MGDIESEAAYAATAIVLSIRILDFVLGGMDRHSRGAGRGSPASKAGAAAVDPNGCAPFVLP